MKTIIYTSNLRFPFFDKPEVRYGVFETMEKVRRGVYI